MGIELNIHHKATEIANCLWVARKGKSIARRIMIQMVIDGIEASRNDPALLTELKRMIKYST